MPQGHSFPQRQTNNSLASAKTQAKSHDQLVIDLANALIKGGLTITHVALPGYQNPPKFGRHEPDIVATDTSGLVHLGEAKTDNDIDSALTEEQLMDFSSRVMTVDNRKVPLHVVVPKHLYEKLDHKLLGMGITQPHVYKWYS